MSRDNDPGGGVSGPSSSASAAAQDRRFLGQERQSDHYASWQAYRGWEAAARQGYERHYCDQHHLSLNVLQMLKRTRGAPPPSRDALFGFGGRCYRGGMERSEKR